MTNVDRSCIMGILGNECLPRKPLLEALWLGLSTGKLLTSAELVRLTCQKRFQIAVLYKYAMYKVDAVHYKETKIICLFSIVIRKQIPNRKTGRCWIRIGQRLKGCGSFRVSSGSGRVWLTPTRENQWLDADKNPPRGFSFRYTSGAAQAPKLPIFFVKLSVNQAKEHDRWNENSVACPFPSTCVIYSSK